MNPEQKAAVELAQRLHSIEEFERDVEPAIGRVQLSVYPSFCLKGLMHDE